MWPAEQKTNPKKQVAIILHCAGPKVIVIFDQFTWTAEGETESDKKDPTKVLAKIEKYCNRARMKY